MNNEEYIKQSFAGLPRFLDTGHLVQLGIYKTIDYAYQARSKGECPPFIKFKNRTLFPKQAVIDFLLARCHSIQPKTEEIYDVCTHDSLSSMHHKKNGVLILDSYTCGHCGLKFIPVL